MNEKNNKNCCVKHCPNCGNHVETTATYTYYCDKCKIAFILPAKSIRVVASQVPA